MPTTLPLFPLNTVLVPGLVLPLHIFEPRYRELIEQLLAMPDESEREFGVIAVRQGRSIDSMGVGALYEIGTATLLREADQFEDGRYDIVTTGSRRFRLHSIDTSRPLITGDVEFLDEPSGESDPALIMQVSRLFGTYRGLLAGQIDVEFADDQGLPDDPTVLSYLITAAMVLMTEERQALIGAADSRQRLAAARGLLTREIGLIGALSALPAIDLAFTQPSPN
ncbi:MAG: hypothetical protein F2793_08245 [Actinobacteria bacterium]|uniref:Unannotated protein n=1 Tax=freshwater metagenome TaxID=449393 RepID=A0A6J7ELS5_9ZZZZ|nr:hypothetical protein [Actinomycetota bacterium]